MKLTELDKAILEKLGSDFNEEVCQLLNKPLVEVAHKYVAIYNLKDEIFCNPRIITDLAEEDKQWLLSRKNIFTDFNDEWSMEPSYLEEPAEMACRNYVLYHMPEE